MPVTDSLVTTLLENIQANLADSTNYSTLAGHLLDEDIAPSFSLVARPTPYAVIVAEPPEDALTAISGVRWWQPVAVYVVSRRAPSPQRHLQMTGTDDIPGLDTLCMEVRQALNRPSPYDDQKPSGSDYTTQTGVLNAEYQNTEYLGFEDTMAYLDEDQSPETGAQSAVAIIRMRYLCVAAR